MDDEIDWKDGQVTRVVVPWIAAFSVLCTGEEPLLAESWTLFQRATQSASFIAGSRLGAASALAHCLCI